MWTYNQFRAWEASIFHALNIDKNRLRKNDLVVYFWMCQQHFYWIKAKAQCPENTAGQLQNLNQWLILNWEMDLLAVDVKLYLTSNQVREEGYNKYKKKHLISRDRWMLHGICSCSIFFKLYYMVNKWSQQGSKCDKKW